MLFRSLVAAAALLTAAPVVAQDGAQRALPVVVIPGPSEGQLIQNAASVFAGKTNEERRDALVRLLRVYGLDPAVQTFEGGTSRTGPMAGSNVVVTLGDGPRDIVLTAHYDAVKLRDGSMSQGIVDNAGSVVAMIEAMKALKGQPTSHRLIFVLTDQEELGLIGAKAWLDAHDKSRIRAVINADVAAYGRTVMYGENNGAQSGFVLAALRSQCAEQGVNCVAFPVYPPSDDRVFSAAGVPVVSLGTQDAVGAHQMWLAFNGGEDNGLKEGFVPPVFQRIHSPEDKLSYLNGEDVARFGRFITDLTLRLDRAAP
ncbi:MAG: Zn-dependent exopeptidase M28 [Alphaproteobacteria bacterium]|uniref:M28 family metallopeptidase n=1 Tax=Brevundimonas sp. TaxID=1871086 RepID=UPI001D2DDE1D|nr:Zn-dependent exopeptidase M28 [Alphaproteobacteria bacterium]MBU1519915.1 Zn-dependent exopeptidase M28 [Alphaproteobacteria bacterium]MBU2029115.1 Zn-dependent exopeptidase M28 [Alphaproteobacteria bacterium]MBU2165381.1 Zn-dependent exopeptidase M28 [Alphaproteobacteria bacterium]MBU2232119.1 Zn-dependent exopeptidase M28 [Alphaproteobacteria bacterium]